MRRWKELKGLKGLKALDAASLQHLDRRVKYLVQYFPSRGKPGKRLRKSSDFILH